MREFIENNPSEYEKPEPTRQTIDELLPRYYEAHGDQLMYETVRLMPIDGHDVAWMRYTGQHASGHALHCSCKFAEGIGWRIKEGGQVFESDSEDDCLPRKVAIYLRQQELKEEYISRFTGNDPFFSDEYALREHLPEIIHDLIAKDKENEFIGEGTNAAHSWGGHFYLQTVQEITGAEWENMWDIVAQMRRDKQIQMDGMVVQEYYEPPEPKWDEHSRLGYQGYTGVAYLPSHDHMPQRWQITILAPDGRIIAEGIEGPQLTHEPVYGPDTSDVTGVEVVIRQVIEQYLWDPTSQS